LDGGKINKNLGMAKKKNKTKLMTAGLGGI
jgi:hypothetical protein